VVAHQQESPLRVYYGTRAQEGQFPFLVSLGTYDGSSNDAERSHFCGGSLIDPHFVLTAAHCVYDKRPDRFNVVLNTTNYKQGLFVNVLGIYVHPNFSIKGNGSADLAVLKLEKPVLDVQIPSLIDGSTINFERNGTEVVFAGWGQTDLEQDPMFAYFAEVQVVEFNSCELMLDQFPWPHNYHQLHAYYYNLCTYDWSRQANLQQACFGDSGAPLVHAITPSPGSNMFKFVQVGILSGGSGFCGDFLGVTSPDVFTRLSLYTEWVNSIVKPGL
jgi:secreted trypsin-like serine protease